MLRNSHIVAENLDKEVVEQSLTKKEAILADLAASLELSFCFIPGALQHAQIRQILDQRAAPCLLPDQALSEVRFKPALGGL